MSPSAPGAAPLHQVLVGASTGDAITGMALKVRDVLRERRPSEVYARHIDANIAGEVRPIEEFQARSSHDGVVVYHVSIGDPVVSGLVAGAPEPLVVWYHNITPSRYFQEVDPAFARHLARGRQELASLADRTELAVTVSEFNASELRELDFGPVEVFRPPVDVQRLHAVDPHMPTWYHLSLKVEGPVILAVGQVLPHKRPDLLLQAFSILTSRHVNGAHLVLAGPERLAPYAAALRAYANCLGLPNVWITGQISDEELAAHFRRADLLTTVSEHEGFCVPLVEAMTFGLPIVARDYGAIGETLGSGGLLLPPDAGPAEVAEAWRLVLTDQVLAERLAAASRRRAAEFRPETSAEAVAARLEQVLVA